MQTEERRRYKREWAKKNRKKTGGKRGRPAGMLNTKPGELSRLYLSGKLSVEDLHKKTSLSMFTLYKALKGQSTQKTRTIIAEALKVSVEKL